MRALSLRQPSADQIVRENKRIECRSWPTKIRGKVYTYASKTPASKRGEDFPRGVIVGTVEIHNCTEGSGGYRWHLRNPKPLSKPRKPIGKPQPVRFNPFPEQAFEEKLRAVKPFEPGK